MCFTFHHERAFLYVSTVSECLLELMSVYMSVSVCPSHILLDSVVLFMCSRRPMWIEMQVTLMHACVCVKVRGCVIYNEIRYECIPIQQRYWNVLLIELLYPIKERKKKIETKEINKTSKGRNKGRQKEECKNGRVKERNGGRKKERIMIKKSGRWSGQWYPSPLIWYMSGYGSERGNGPEGLTGKRVEKLS